MRRPRLHPRLVGGRFEHVQDDVGVEAQRRDRNRVRRVGVGRGLECGGAKQSAQGQRQLSCSIQLPGLIWSAVDRQRRPCERTRVGPRPGSGTGARRRSRAATRRPRCGRGLVGFGRRPASRLRGSRRDDADATDDPAAAAGSVSDSSSHVTDIAVDLAPARRKRRTCASGSVRTASASHSSSSRD